MRHTEAATIVLVNRPTDDGHGVLILIAYLIRTPAIPNFRWQPRGRTAVKLSYQR
jgi:hypothetical protein